MTQIPYHSIGIVLCINEHSNLEFFLCMNLYQLNTILSIYFVRLMLISNSHSLFFFSILFWIFLFFILRIGTSFGYVYVYSNSDQNYVKMIYEKLSRLYHRIIKTHENINNLLESIRIWGKVPLYQRREGNATSLLDIDDRSLKCKTRCVEVSNSKKLIEFTMEENYRLLFGLPSLERKKEFGKDRLRNTIIRKFGRHQAKDKFERMPSVVRHIFFLLISKFIEPNFYHISI